MAVRRNILSSAALRQAFITGCLRLKAEIPAGGTLSTWDTFVVWHHRAMMTLTPPTQGSRNAAHGGPVFLPWHRYMLVLIERNFQRVLNDPNFGLPYWDWATDGQKTPAQQRTAPIWGVLGGSGTPITTGPFSGTQWRVRVEMDPNTGQLVGVNRRLNRELGLNPDAPRLPNRAAARAALLQTIYDTSPWGQTSQSSFRNQLEGWSPPGLHNRVHVWVGGDMLLSTSPNDPAFYLNHCNVDRLWSTWQEENGVTNYRPTQSQAGAPVRHRPNDLLFPLQVQAPRVRDMFNVASVYTYS